MLRLFIIIFLVITTTAEAGETNKQQRSDKLELCSPQWEHFIEDKVLSGDGKGHGPDIGSAEWKSVIEFKLGIRGNPSVPDKKSEAWCHYIDSKVRNKPVLVESGKVAPSFSCDNAREGSIEAMICKDPELSALDRKLSAVYISASKQVTGNNSSNLKAEQRGWIKGRNACWKSEDKRSCVQNTYKRRSAELQAKYQLVSYNGPVRFTCDGNDKNEVVVKFFQTDPLTLIAERGDSVSLMYIQPSASGSLYRGRNETLWEQQGKAVITWGYNAVKMNCHKEP